MSPKLAGKDVSWGTIGYHARGLFAVALSLAVLVGGGLFVYSKVHDAYIEWRTEEDYIGEGTEEVEVVIPKGANVTQTGDILWEAGVVRSTRAFRNAAQKSGQAEKLSYGRFRLRKELPAETAFNMLLDSRNEVKLWVTFPEGTNKAEQAKIISTGITAGETKLSVDMDTVLAAYEDPSVYGLPEWAPPDSLEGFLFPSTYQVGEPIEAPAIIAGQVNQFKKIAEETGLQQRAEEAGRNPLDVLVTASIIEGEVHDPDYQPLVAAVIYNRLAKDMKLEMDSTVHFAVGKTGRVSTTEEDRKFDSPYNTYLYTGLPPGPINSPGQTAIEAALSPSDTDALFFVTVNLDTGETKFANTLEDHNKNVAELRAWCTSTGSPLC
ncbi:MAG TPA: endolytic transglycosylase MltG [Arachnia sp.]|nr:endolytic transglycosylase MltG [Arachnia sp.]HMT87018.1 endolytic transglycosylase MltG [Arachnia sp.]